MAMVISQQTDPNLGRRHISQKYRYYIEYIVYYITYRVYYIQYIPPRLGRLGWDARLGRQVGTPGLGRLGWDAGSGTPRWDAPAHLNKYPKRDAPGPPNLGRLGTPQSGTPIWDANLGRLGPPHLGRLGWDAHLGRHLGRQNTPFSYIFI